MAGKKDRRRQDQPLLAFAGIWTDWTGTRVTKSNPIEGALVIVARGSEKQDSAPDVIA